MPCLATAPPTSNRHHQDYSISSRIHLNLNLHLCHWHPGWGGRSKSYWRFISECICWTWKEEEARLELEPSQPRILELSPEAPKSGFGFVCWSTFWNSVYIRYVNNTLNMIAYAFMDNIFHNVIGRGCLLNKFTWNYLYPSTSPDASRKTSGGTLTQDKKTLMSSGQEQLSLLKQCCEADIVLQDVVRKQSMCRKMW